MAEFNQYELSNGSRNKCKQGGRGIGAGSKKGTIVRLTSNEGLLRPLGKGIYTHQAVGRWSIEVEIRGFK